MTRRGARRVGDFPTDSFATKWRLEGRPVERLLDPIQKPAPFPCKLTIASTEPSPAGAQEASGTNVR